MEIYIIPPTGYEAVELYMLHDVTLHMYVARLVSIVKKSPPEQLRAAEQTNDTNSGIIRETPRSLAV